MKASHYAFLICLLLSLAQGQDFSPTFQADNQKVNQNAVYRVTLNRVGTVKTFLSGTRFKTTFPSTVSIATANGGSMSICRRYFTDTKTTSTAGMSSCIYDSTNRMVTFSLTTAVTFNFDYTFEIGLIKNPASTVTVSGFKVRIENSGGTSLYDLSSAASVFISPGDMSSQTVQPGSLKVADVTSYTFSFKISNPIPANGRIELTFPSSGAVAIPVGLVSTDISVKVYDAAAVNPSISMTKTRVITMTGMFPTAIAVDSTKSIVITIGKITNPYSLAATDSFKIETEDSSGFYIDRAATLLSVQMTQPADLIPSSETPLSMNPIVRSNTLIQFVLSFLVPYDLMSYIEVTFPPEVSVELTALLCYKQKGFDNQMDLCELTSTSPYVIRITDLFNDQEVIFSMGFAKNPDTNKPTSTFYASIFNSAGAKICESTAQMVYSSEPDAIYMNFAERSSNIVGNLNDNSVVLDFTLSNFVTSTEYLVISLPYQQVLYDPSATLVCEIKLAAVDTYTITPCNLDTQKSTDYFTVSLMTTVCGTQCDDSAQFHVQFTGVRNPQWIVAPITKYIQISTMTNDLLWTRDKVKDDFSISPELIEGTISTITLAKSGAIVGRATSLDLQFTPLNPIQAQGIIRLYLPQYGFYQFSDLSIACKDTLSGATLTCTASLQADSSIDYIELTDVCTTLCPAGASISITISSLKNRASIKEITNQFTIKTYTKELYRIDKGTLTSATGLSLMPAPFTSLALPSPASPIYTGASSTYTLNIVSENGIAVSNSKTFIVITIPGDLAFLTSTPSCQAKVSSADLTCTVSVASMQITVQNPDPSSTFAGQQIQITLGTGVLRNPQSSRPSQPFLISTYATDPVDGKPYLVDQDLTSLLVTADTPNALIEGSVSRGSLIINTQTDYTFTFTTFNPIPSGGFVQILIPKVSIVIDSAASLTFKSLPANQALQAASALGVGDSSTNYYTLTLKEWCSVSGASCPTGSVLSFVMSGAKNYRNTKTPQYQFGFKTLTFDNYFIDAISGIDAQFLSAGPFTSLVLTQDNQMIGELTTLTVTAVFSNQVTPGDQGTIHIRLPSGLFFVEQATSPTCLIASGPTTCNFTTQSTILGDSYYDFYVRLDCQVNSCATGVSKVVKIGGLLNRYNSKPFSGQISARTLDDDTEPSVFDSSTVQFSSTALTQLLTVNTNGVAQSVSRSNFTVATATTLVFSFTLRVPHAKNSIIQAFIPLDSFDKATSYSCLNADTQVAVDCSSPSVTSLHHIIQFKEFCPSSDDYCFAGTTLSIQIMGFKNRYNTKPGATNLYYKTFTSDNYAVELSQTPLLPDVELIPSTGTVYDDKVVLSSKYVNRVTNLTLTADLQNKLLVGDYVRVSFSTPIFKTPPANFRLDANLTTDKDTRYTASTTQYVNQGQLISQLSFQSPREYSTVGQIFRIQLRGLVNMDEDAPLSSSITVTTYTQESGNQYLISTGVLTLTAKDLLSPTPFRQILLKRDKQELEAATTLTITYQHDIAVLPNSFIEIKVPKSQLKLQEGVTPSCTLKDLAIDCQMVTNDDSYLTLTTPSTLCALQAECPLNTTQTLKLSGFQNPLYKFIDTLPFLFRIISQGKYPILSTEETFLNATPEFKIPQIFSLKVSQLDNTVYTYQNTTYKFSFYLPNTVPVTSKLLINFPLGSVTYDTASTSKMQCWKENGFGKVFAYDCKVYKQSGQYLTVMSFENFCVIDDCSQSSFHSFMITNISNTNYNRTRDGTIVVQTTLPAYQIIAEGTYQESILSSFIPSPVANFTVSRDSNRVGQSSLDLYLSVISLYPIPDQSTLMFYIPLQQVIIQNSSQLSCSAMSIYSSSRAIDCQTIMRNESHLLMLVKEWCIGDCKANTTFTLKIKDTQNPTSLEANDPTYSFGVLIQDKEGYALMETRSGVVAQPPLFGVNFTYIDIQRDSKLLGGDSSLTVTFQIAQRIIQASNLTLQIPLNTSFVSQQGQSPCYWYQNKDWQPIQCVIRTFANITVFGQNPIANITIPNFCTRDDPCMPNIIQKLKFTVQNPRSAYIQDTINGTTKYNLTLTQGSLEVGRKAFLNSFNQFQPNQLQAALSVFQGDQGPCTLTGSSCSLQFAVTTTNPFVNNSNSYLQVQLPSQLALSKTASCSGQLFNEFKLTCTLISALNQVLVRIPNNMSTINYQNSSYSYEIALTVSNVTMPSSTKPTDGVTLKTLEGWGVTEYVIDQYSGEQLSVTMADPSPFNAINITRKTIFAGNQTDLEFELRAAIELPKDTVLEIALPQSDILVMQSASPKCRMNGGFFNSGSLKCTLADSQNLLVPGICGANGCQIGELIPFVLQSSFIKNAYSKPEQQESVKVVAFLEGLGDQKYLMSAQTSDLFIQPTINGTSNQSGGGGDNNGSNGNTNNSSAKEGLTLSSLTFQSLVASDFQSIKIRAAYSKGVFNQEFISVKFTNISFYLDQFYQISGKINQQVAQLRTFTTKNEYGESIIESIVMSCDDQVCKQRQGLDITFEGFRNPYFKTSSVDKNTPPRLTFAELKQFPNITLNQTSLVITSFASNLTQNALKSNLGRLSNNQPGATNTSVQVLFTLKNKPKTANSGQVTISLPNGYSVSNSRPTCVNIFTKDSLACSSSSNTVSVQGYFEQSKSPAQTSLRRDLQASSDGLSTIVTVAIEVQGLTNPSNVTSSPLTVQVAQIKRFYANDNTTFILQTFTVSNQCADSNCSQCSSQNPSLCTKCDSEALRPLLQEYTCRGKCSPGFFEFDAICYPCAYGCKECQSYNQCSKCENNQLLIDGSCYEKVNIYDQSLQCPDGTKKSAEFGCVSTQSCAATTCSVCGVDNSFCLSCSAGYSLLQGSCVASCPSGYTRNSNNACEKCDFSCLSCNGTSASCSTCRSSSSFRNVLDQSTQTCGSGCSESSLLDPTNPFICNACSSSCKSCSVTLDNCTSCNYDRSTGEKMYFFEGKCIRTCPSGFIEDKSTHECKESVFSSAIFGPLYLIAAALLSLSLTLFSHIKTKRTDDPLGIMIALFSQIEYVNRVIIVILLWRSEQLFIYCIAGLGVTSNLFLGIYFTSVVTDSIANHIKSIPKDSKLFKATVVLSQISGTNTMRLISSNFLGLKAFSNSNLQTLPYFFKPLENMSLLALMFNTFQLANSIAMCMVFTDLEFGFGISSLICNVALNIMLVVKWKQYKELIKHYVPITQVTASVRESNSGQAQRGGGSQHSAHRVHAA